MNKAEVFQDIWACSVDELTNQDIEKFFLGLVFREIFKMNFERFLILNF